MRACGLNPDAGTVSYARSCRFRGRMVPHLVVQTEMGPVTVMVLVHESVAKPVPFDEQGYRGVIVPVPGHGSLAVLARGQDADLNAVEGSPRGCRRHRLDGLDQGLKSRPYREVDEPARARCERRMVHLELHGDLFQTLGQGATRRARRRA